MAKIKCVCVKTFCNFWKDFRHTEGHDCFCDFATPTCGQYSPKTKDRLILCEPCEYAEEKKLVFGRTATTYRCNEFEGLVLKSEIIPFDMIYYLQIDNLVVVKDGKLAISFEPKTTAELIAECKESEKQ